MQNMASLPLVHSDGSDGSYSDDTGSEYEYDSGDPTSGYLFIAHLIDNEYLIDWCRYIEPVHAQYGADDRYPFVCFVCEYPRERCIELWNNLEQVGYQYDVANRSHWNIGSADSFYHIVDLMQHHAEC